MKPSIDIHPKYPLYGEFESPVDPIWYIKKSFVSLKKPLFIEAIISTPFQNNEIHYYPEGMLPSNTISKRAFSFLQYLLSRKKGAFPLYG